MNWTDGQAHEAWKRSGAVGHGYEGMRLAMTYALELAAARGGTMTADELEKALNAVALSQVGHGADRLREHIAARGARVVALEEALRHRERTWAEKCREVEALERAVAALEEQVRAADLERDEAASLYQHERKQRQDAEQVSMECGQRTRAAEGRCATLEAELAKQTNLLSEERRFHVYDVDELSEVKAELARLKPSGQVAEDERSLRSGLAAFVFYETRRPLDDALSRLAAAAQEREAVLADNAALTLVAEAVRGITQDLAENGVAADCPYVSQERAQELLAIIDARHPGAALLEVVSALRQYQHRDEPDLATTTRRLLEERGRIAHMVDAEEHRKALVRARNKGLEKAAVEADAAAERAERTVETERAKPRPRQTTIQEALLVQVAMSSLAASIRAMKEPES